MDLEQQLSVIKWKALRDVAVAYHVMQGQQINSNPTLAQQQEFVDEGISIVDSHSDGLSWYYERLYHPNYGGAEVEALVTEHNLSAETLYSMMESLVPQSP